MQGIIVYKGFMSGRTPPTLRSKIFRNFIALGVACGITFLVFQFMAAFNGVMKVINEMTTNMALQCPKGYETLNNPDGTISCKPLPPPTTPGVVSVTLAPLQPAAPKPQDPKPKSAAPAPKQP